MARKGALKEKTVYHMNVGLDRELYAAVEVGCSQNERTYNQEVRYQLRQAYGLQQVPAEDQAGVSA